jgi:hypothetical protein
VLEANYGLDGKPGFDSREGAILALAVALGEMRKALIVPSFVESLFANQNTQEHDDTVRFD